MSTTQTLRHCSIGRSPSGFTRLHAEIEPNSIGRLIGYDPRTLSLRSRSVPANVDPAIVELQRSVQRSIEPKRVAAMVEYLRGAARGEFADWGPLDIVTDEKPDTRAYDATGSVQLPLSAPYFVTDGQHRYCALLDFCRDYPVEAKDFTQGITISFLPADKLSAWAGQSFHDKNRLAKPVGATIALRADTRDPYNVMARVAGQHPAISAAGGLDLGHGTSPPTSPYFTSLASIYKFVRAFHVGRKGLGPAPLPEPTPEEAVQLQAQLSEYLGALALAFPSWHDPKTREEYLSRSSAAIQALAVIGHDLFTKVPDTVNRGQLLARISEKNLNWRRTNPDWVGIIGTIHTDKDGVQTVAPASARQYIDGTIAYLRMKSGLDIYVKDDEDTTQPG